MNSCEDELFISDRMREKLNNHIDNRKIFLKETRKELAHRIFDAICELNYPFYINYYLIHTTSKIAYLHYSSIENKLTKLNQRISFIQL